MKRDNGKRIKIRKKTAGPVSDEQQKITITKNGPYVVTGEIPLSDQVITNDAEGYSYAWHEGKKYPLQGNYSLCRCGHTKTRPFCDGIHTKAGFDAIETANRKPYADQAERFESPSLILTDFIDLCASARFCDRAGGIWNLTRRSDNPDAKSIAIIEAENCPSGRLVVWYKKTLKVIEPEFVPSIGLIEYPDNAGRGPIWVRGRIPVESADGTTYEVRNRVTLCRCGRSENKPFCDSSHLELMSK